MLDLSFLQPIEKAMWLSKVETNAPIVSNTLSMSATTAQKAAGKEVRIIGMPILPHYFERQKFVEFSFSYGGEEISDEVNKLLQALGKNGELVKDTIAGVFPRTLAMIVNEATFAVQELEFTVSFRVATAGLLAEQSPTVPANTPLS